MTGVVEWVSGSSERLQRQMLAAGQGTQIYYAKMFTFSACGGDNGPNTEFDASRGSTLVTSWNVLFVN